MVGTWQRLAHYEISSAGNVIDTASDTSFSGDDFAVKENLIIEYFIKRPTSGDQNIRLRFNNNSTGGKYSYRTSLNGGAYSDGTGQNDVELHSGVVNNNYGIIHVTNIKAEEKLAIAEVIGQNADGVGSSSVPTRRESVFKWIDQTDNIKRVSINQTSTGEFESGSYVTVWGASGDTVTDEKTTLTNVPTNSRYEETDTRKIYRYDESALSPSFRYKFSEASGDVVNHGSVASADLTVTSLTRDQTTPSGIGNGMKTTDKNTGYAQNTSRVNDYKFMHDGTSKWSVTFWLKSGDTPSDSTTTERMIFGNVWTDDNGIGFGIRLAKNSDNSSSACRLQLMIANNTNTMPMNYQSANGMMPDVSNWHFYCMTYDPTLSSNNLTVSRDASTSGAGFSQADTSNENWSTSNPTRKVTYFARPTSSYDHGIVGTLAQVMIFKDTILTQANKVSLFASGNGTTTIPTVTEWKERGTA